MKTILIIRHTKPDVTEGICYGATDLGLDKTFKSELDEIAKKVEPFKVETVYSSPLKRCSQLATNLFPNCKPITDKNLVELNFGDWEMKPWKEINSNELSQWAELFWNVSPPNGETFSALHNRTIDTWQNKIVNTQENAIAVVCHAGVIRSLLIELLGIPYNKVFSLSLAYGAIVKIDYYNENSYQINFL